MDALLLHRKFQTAVLREGLRGLELWAASKVPLEVDLVLILERAPVAVVVQHVLFLSPGELQHRETVELHFLVLLRAGADLLEHRLPQVDVLQFQGPPFSGAEADLLEHQLPQVDVLQFQGLPFSEAEADLLEHRLLQVDVLQFQEPPFSALLQMGAVPAVPQHLVPPIVHRLLRVSILELQSAVFLLVERALEQLWVVPVFFLFSLARLVAQV